MYIYQQKNQDICIHKSVCMCIYVYIDVDIYIYVNREIELLSLFLDMVHLAQKAFNIAPGPCI